MRNHLPGFGERSAWSCERHACRLVACYVLQLSAASRPLQWECPNCMGYGAKVTALPRALNPEYLVSAAGPRISGEASPHL